MDETEKKVKQDITSEPPAEQPPPRQTEGLSEKEMDEEDFNFGGLPQRDLKKNLGCG